MKKHAIILGIILLFIFSTAAECGTQVKEPDTATPYYGGTEGLVMKLLPPSQTSDTTGKYEVWEDETFHLELEVKNKGEYTVEAHEAEFELKGISQQDYSGLDFTRDNEEDIDRVMQWLEDGEITYVDFGDGKFERLVGRAHMANVFIVATYPYETEILVPNVCFKYDLNDDRICNVDETKETYHSGGPIDVGTAKELPAGKGACS